MSHLKLNQVGKAFARVEVKPLDCNGAPSDSRGRGPRFPSRVLGEVRRSAVPMPFWGGDQSLSHFDTIEDARAVLGDEWVCCPRGSNLGLLARATDLRVATAGFDRLGSQTVVPAALFIPRANAVAFEEMASAETQPVSFSEQYVDGLDELARLGAIRQVRRYGTEMQSPWPLRPLNEREWNLIGMTLAGGRDGIRGGIRILDSSPGFMPLHANVTEVGRALAVSTSSLRYDRSCGKLVLAGTASVRDSRLLAEITGHAFLAGLSPRTRIGPFATSQVRADGRHGTELIDFDVPHAAAKFFSLADVTCTRLDAKKIAVIGAKLREDLTSQVPMPLGVWCSDAHFDSEFVTSADARKRFFQIPDSVPTVWVVTNKTGLRECFRKANLEGLTLRSEGVRASRNRNAAEIAKIIAAAGGVPEWFRRGLHTAEDVESVIRVEQLSAANRALPIDEAARALHGWMCGAKASFEYKIKERLKDLIEASPLEKIDCSKKFVPKQGRYVVDFAPEAFFEGNPLECLKAVDEGLPFLAARVIASDTARREVMLNILAG